MVNKKIPHNFLQMLLLTLLSIFFFSYSVSANDYQLGIKDSFNYQIDGIVENAPDSTLIVLEFLSLNLKSDTLYLNHNRFQFIGKLGQPIYALLWVENQAMPVILEKGKIDYLLKGDDLENPLIISEGYYNSQLNATLKLQELIEDSISLIKDEIGRLNSLEQSKRNILQGILKEKEQAFRAYLINYLKNDKDNVVAVGLLLTEFLIDPNSISSEYLRNFYSSLGNNMKNDIYGIKILHIINLREFLSGRKSIFVIEEFNRIANQIKHNPKKNYVLINLWASWCIPCRKENKMLVNAFQKYNKRGFTILGISFDKNKADWLNAIKKDKLIWNNTCDFQGLNHLATFTYGIKSIPFNLLLNKKGYVVSKNLKENELLNFLKKHIK